MKVIVGVIWTRRWSVWIKPWCTLPATCLWDTLVASSIMDQAKIRGLGVSTCIEVFNEVMENHQEEHGGLSEKATLQVARAVGVAIVKHGTMYPTMEMLLRHAIQFLGLKGSKAVTETNEDGSGNIDNYDRFVQEMQDLTSEEQIVVLQIHLLTFCVNGTMDHHEADHYRTIIDAATPGLAVFDMTRVSFMCQR